MATTTGMDIIMGMEISAIIGNEGESYRYGYNYGYGHYASE